jgi:predicted nucleic acid-binding Zn finger protein
MAHPERLTLERLIDEARSERELSRSSWERLRLVFGDRFDKAWRLVLEKRIKRYIFRPSDRVVWVAVGQSGEYRILPAAEYCSCDDFYFRVVDGDAGVCYHLLAQRLAEALNSYQDVLEEDDSYSLLAAEWRAWTNPQEY